jgi:phage tail protein X
MSLLVTARQYDTLDLICHRQFGATAAVTEAALELNPGLAAFGEILPEGTKVALPDHAPEPTRQMINLWD